MLVDGQNLLKMSSRDLDHYRQLQVGFVWQQTTRNLVPYLIPYLGDNELDRRAQAMTWIVLIGPDALPPLVAACKHPNGRIRTNVAALLGARSLRHPYSLGYLRAMQQTDELKEVQDEAGRAFEANLGELNGSAGPVDDAKVYFLRTANQFYLNPFRNPFDTRRYSPMAGYSSSS